MSTLGIRARQMCPLTCGCDDPKSALAFEQGIYDERDVANEILEENQAMAVRPFETSYSYSYQGELPDSYYDSYCNSSK